jgi:hypothetical protein
MLVCIFIYFLAHILGVSFASLTISHFGNGEELFGQNQFHIQIYCLWVLSHFEMANSGANDRRQGDCPTAATIMEMAMEALEQQQQYNTG